MQFEMARSSCPLCRRPLSASPTGLAPGTRLCEQCRSIVQKAFPMPNSRVAASAAAAQDGGACAIVQQVAPVLDRPLLDLPVFTEDGSSVVESFEQEAQSPMLFELGDELSDLREDEDSGRKAHTEEAELPDMPADGASQPRAGASSNSVEARPADTDNIAAVDSQPHAQPETLTEPAAASHTARASLLDVQSTEPDRTGEEAAVDPWADPLPAWDYSHTEWPVLVGSARRRSFRTLIAPFAALVVLACAGGFYLSIHQPASGERLPGVAADSSAAGGVAASADPHVSARSADSGAQQAAAASSSNTLASIDSNPSQATEDGNAHGKFSLQAAAFPTQAAADEFAEKLRHTGVPSYVISTDLGRRGKWFRVRVGRFNAADDAQRFAAEAQLRAKAGGMSLQVMVCQYEQP